MRPDGSLRPTKPPRGLILSTGEDVPGGESVRGRMLIVDVSEGDIDSGRLTACQRDAAAGLYAEAMAAYLRFLASDLDGARATGRSGTASRSRLAVVTAGRRGSSASSARRCGCTSTSPARQAEPAPPTSGSAVGTRCSPAQAQTEHQAEENPALRFAALIWSALTSKRAHVADRLDPSRVPEGSSLGPSESGWNSRTIGGVDPREEWIPQGPCVGWTGDGLVYLDPHSAYSMAAKLANEGGRALGVGAKTLWKRMREAGLLALHDAGQRNTYKVRIGKRLRNTITVTVSVLSESGTAGKSGTDGPDPRDSADFVPGSGSRFQERDKKQGTGTGNGAQGNGGFPGAVPPVPDVPDSGRTQRDGEQKACAVPGCGRQAVLTGPGGDWCALHLEPQHRRVGSCLYCRDLVYPDDTVPADGGVLHHRCADAWATRGARRAR